VKIRIGQVFRVSHRAKRETGVPEDPAGYTELTRGGQGSGADVQKGIWAYKPFEEPGQGFDRIPAILLHSNPFKEGTVGTPWVDIIEPDAGYGIYNGDNRRSSVHPLEARGNSLLVRTQRFYDDPELRKFAPPVLLFTQRQVGGNRRGYREFSGYGVPVEFRLVSQREKRSDKYFTNLVVELALFRLDTEDEVFDWEWIDRRRDSGATWDRALSAAPAAWKLWVREGKTAVEKSRRRVAARRIVTAKEQLDCPEADQSLLREVVRYFATRHHAFEGLASLIAVRVIGPGCKRGWVTRRSADGGVDFVCRLDIGSEFSRVPIVVLGQAKCQRSVSGSDVARLVARLQRGWIGVFVTTGVFSSAVQRELHLDRYPVMLINGKRLARELRLVLTAEGIALKELLDRERIWYEANVQPMEADRILNETSFGTEIGVFGRTAILGEHA
jgi:hypothetical protein